MAASEVKLLHFGSDSISSGRPSLKMRPLCIIVTLSTTRSATSMSCSMMMKPMCAGSEVRISTSSRPLRRRQARGRLVEQDEARRAGQRQRDLELALLAMASSPTRRSLARPVRCTASTSISAALQQGIVGARADQREAASRNAAAGEIDVVEHATGR